MFRERSISAARPSLGSSQFSGVCDIDGSKLRSTPVESALKFGSAHFAAGQGHGLKNPLVAERWFLIGLFRRAAALLCNVFVCVPVLFSHKKWASATQPAEPNAERSTTNHFSSEAYNKKRISPIVTAGTCKVSAKMPSAKAIGVSSTGWTWKRRCEKISRVARRLQRQHQPCLPAILLFIPGGLPGSWSLDSPT